MVNFNIMNFGAIFILKCRINCMKDITNLLNKSEKKVFINMYTVQFRLSSRHYKICLIQKKNCYTK